jgi:hypothetical protein
MYMSSRKLGARMPTHTHIQYTQARTFTTKKEIGTKLEHAYVYIHDACIHVCMHVYMYSCMYSCIQVFVCIFVNTRTRLRLQTKHVRRSPVRQKACRTSCMHVCMYVCKKQSNYARPRICVYMCI